MKIRTDFVTNSSSSSFVLALSDDLLEIINDDEERDMFELKLGMADFKYWHEDGHEASELLNTLISEGLIDEQAYLEKHATSVVTKQELVDEILRTLRAAGEITPEQAADEVNYEILDDKWNRIGIHNRFKEWVDSVYFGGDNTNNFEAHHLEFELENKETEVHYIKVEYADEDGRLGSIMEHSGIFDYLPHLKTSHH